MKASDVVNKISKIASKDPTETQFLARFFKTGPGQYGEGDHFIGVRMPALRAACKPFWQLPLPEIEKLLESPIHEIRMAAVIIMAEQSKRAKPETQKSLFNLYLRRTDRINNWDIVDVSCRDVVGEYLQDKPRGILLKLARSSNLWDRRIAMVSTWAFIRRGDLDDTFKIALALLQDKQDLIHKAVGWMLREAGKRDETRLLEFLNQNGAKMPRTALRYAIERLSPEVRAAFLQNASTP